VTGPEFHSIRKSLGLGTVAWGRALGYQGSDASVSAIVRRFEAPHGRPIPERVARLAEMYRKHGVPSS
jgi:hypothetical protein